MKYDKEKVEIWNQSDFFREEWSGGPDSVYVDAIFGTGLTREINDESLVRTIDRINGNWMGRVLSIDIPSGLNADTGSVMGVAVNANITATFMGKKRGMFTHDGCAVSYTHLRAHET